MLALQKILLRRSEKNGLKKIIEVDSANVYGAQMVPGFTKTPCGEITTKTGSMRKVLIFEPFLRNYKTIFGYQTNQKQGKSVSNLALPIHLRSD